MKFILIAIIALSVLACSKPAQPTLKKITIVQSAPHVPAPVRTSQVVNKSVALEVINLTEDNMIVMDQVFNDQSVTAVMLELQKLSDKLKAKDTIYLVLSSPGGSVDAGLRLLSFAKALPQKIKTLTLFSASMAFQTVQELDERLILDTGTVMSHRGSFGCKGEASGEIETCMRFTMSIFNALEAKAAERMGMTIKAYSELIRDEYWAYGPDAVASKAVDRMVLAKCGKGLQATKVVAVDTFFGAFNVEISKCPLIPGYISVQPMDQKAKQDTGVTELYVKRMYENKREFVKEYITTNKWTQFQK